MSRPAGMSSVQNRRPTTLKSYSWAASLDEIAMLPATTVTSGAPKEAHVPVTYPRRTVAALKSVRTRTSIAGRALSAKTDAMKTPNQSGPAITSRTHCTRSRL